MNVWRVAWRVANHRRGLFWVGVVLFVAFFCFPVANGWLLGRGYTALRHHDTRLVYRCAIGIAVIEMVRMATIHAGALIWTQVWVHMQTLLRANLLTAQLASGGPQAGRPVGSAGEALTHFRDDTEDVAMFIDGFVDLSAGLAFTTLAAMVLGSIDGGAAAVLLIPLAGVVLATRSLDGRIKQYRTADRAAAMEVSGLLGDVMSAVTTVKVNGAEASTLERLAGLVDRRRHTAVKDRVLEESVQAFSQGAADVGLGLVLLVSASALASGRFAVGQLAIFAAYLGWLSFLPRMAGRVMARRKQAEVAVARMRPLVADEDSSNLVTARDLPIGPRVARTRPVPPGVERVRLERLEVRGLSATFPGGAGVVGVDFAMERGSFVVLTGPIGSGKSTLLRALLGLSHNATTTGDVLWNGELLGDRGAFLIPPNAAFLPQVPQLISDSLADNITLGGLETGRLTDADLATALALAVVDEDVAAMADGAATRIGPRGLRLSGGQRQRVAAARALVHRPELVVFDDVSSALDVETELQLWEHLASLGMTVLAVSHREVAFQRADRILRLESGRLI